ncbi:polymorphic toxin-type HINT domain-containing protein [Streptomyces sp. NBC_01239]|uniref:RHS repeat-associated core domain-containing protein n=1 Tax=Streptomyces sp. NBC_01239 TaxID=2903792 RepID=UPI00225262B8|nr:RHS repeat-associated core domain-containing protein [Streptomyces sp. NBC_01239]MCX4811802.1 polymorphic toxin-type HINT domain-containing protein [Streptomyces sp. NBC_01239]
MSQSPWYRSARPAWRSGRRRAALVLGLALSIGLLPQYAPEATADTGLTLPKPQTNLDDPVRGKNATPKTFKKTDQAKKAAVKKADTTHWPTAGSADVTLSGKAAEAKGLPLTAKAAGGAKAADSVRVQVLSRKATEAAGVDGVLFTVARSDGDATKGTAQVSLDYSDFADAYGGGYGSRLQLVQYPECVLTTPEKKACSTPTYLKSSNDPARQTLSATVQAAGDTSGLAGQLLEADSSSSSATVLAATASSGGDGGDYKATSLAASSQWGVDTSSGAFTWNYPMTTPPVPGGLQPNVGLSYNSQSIDGQTATTNNQGSWIGQGFSYDPGYIERSYKACADDGHDDTNGDQCWAYDNATLSLSGGTSGQLIKDDTTGEWRISSDDNSKVEHLTGATNGDNNGEYWKITTGDGTQYYFGLDRLPGYASGNEETASTWTTPVYGDDSGEPCYNATFADAYCTQAWRWNLDYVVDPHGAAMSYYYGTETNYYTQGLKTTENGKSYIRGGYLKRIDYGQRSGKVYSTKPAAQVVFTTAERCIGDLTDCSAGALTDSTAADWPDVPWDQNCKTDTKCPGQNSPTFWTRKQLTKVTTQIRTGDSTYSPVDEWNLTHIFTDNGDGSKSLWLNKIDHTGKVGTDVSVPSVELYGTQLANRVDTTGDNLQPFYRFRLSGVKNETGGALSVNYADTQCTTSNVPAEDSSTKRCFPVKWVPPGATDTIVDWFHKYVVASVVQTDLTGGTADQITSYTYGGAAGWRKNPADGITKDEDRTWSDWRGYGKVTVVTSDGTNSAANTKTEHVFFRGLDGDVDKDGDSRSATVTDSNGVSYDDSDWKAGQELETITYNGAAVTEKSVTVPWTSVTGTQTESWATRRSRYLATGSTDTYTALAVGGWRHTKSTTTYDSATGRATQVDDDGEVGVADNQCTRTQYADSASLHLYSYVSRVEKVGVDCSSTPDRTKDVISDDLTYYDGSTTLGAAPTKGDATTTKRLSSYTGTTATYQTTAATTYDDYGRPLVAKDATTASSSTTYTSSTAYTDTYGLATKSTVTNVDGWTTSTEYAPQWGLASAKVDMNGQRTDLAYDGLGRLVSVWLPDRSKASSFTASLKYEYLVRGDDGPTAVHTQKIQADGKTYGSEWSLYDGYLRPRQEQTQGAGGGRMVADTLYDGSGRVVKVNDDYYASGAPSSALFDPVNADLDAQTITEYDGAGRTTASVFKVQGTEKYRTTYAYGGDRVTTTPPTGGTKTTVVTDGRDRTTTQIAYPADGDAVTTSYGYDAAGRLKKVTDDEGNNWSYDYDQLGRKKSAVDPDTGSSSYTYDDLDRQTSVTVNGNKTSTLYDELGRAVSTWQGEATTGTKLSVTKYDTIAKGELYGVYTYKDGAVYSSVTYPVLDETNDFKPTSTKYFLSKTAEPQLGGTYEYTTQYNRDGSVQGEGLPAAADLSGEALAYVYDDLQRPVGLNSSIGGLSYVTSASYSPTSNLEQLELYTGESTAKKTLITNTYEAGTDRLTNSRVDVEGASSVAYDADYTYDASGNVLSIADTPAGGTSDVQCFTYDGLQRLTDAWTSSVTPNGANGTGSTQSACSSGASSSTVGGVSPYWTEYGYDSLGNRKSDVRHGLNGTATATRSYVYGDGSGPNGTDSGPHTVASIMTKTDATATTPQVTSQDSYTYDASGNTATRVLSGDTQSLAWDKQGELITVTNADGTVTSYKYDADGQRLLQDTPTEKTFYLPGTELHLDKSTSKVTATRYYSFGDDTVAMREADGVHFLASDHQGTAELAVDAKTGTTTRRRTDPFGNARDDSSSSSTGWVNDKGFVGGTIQASTGLTTLGAREYDADTGRFISADPIVDYTDPQQINGYAYANNSPVSHSDASGLRLADCVGGWNECGPGPSKHRGAVGNRDSSGSGSTPSSTYTPAQAKADSARAAEDAAKAKAIAIAKELGKIIADELGITDALDCFTTGSLGSCGATAANVVTSLIGGGPVGKLVSKYWYRVNKAYALGKRIVGLGKKLWDGFKDWRKSKKAAEAAETAVKECNSFTPDTQVLMADGSTKKIEDVDIGEKVLAADPDTGKTKAETVTAEIKGTGLKRLVKVTIDIDGKKGAKTASVTATDGHPFWVPELHEWLRATDLVPGEWLSTSSGTRVQITAVKRWTLLTATVHNLTVGELHTYYVMAGTEAVLVHNAGRRSNPEQVCPIGAYAVESIPARSKSQVFTDEERDKIDDLGFMYGCHTCGILEPGGNGRFVPDHQPISSWVRDGTPQRLYPQCRPCSSRQGGWAGQLKKVMRDVYGADD